MTVCFRYRRDYNIHLIQLSIYNQHQCRTYHVWCIVYAEILLFFCLMCLSISFVVFFGLWKRSLPFPASPFKFKPTNRIVCVWMYLFTDIIVAYVAHNALFFLITKGEIRPSINVMPLKSAFTSIEYGSVFDACLIPTVILNQYLPTYQNILVGQADYINATKLNSSYENLVAARRFSISQESNFVGLSCSFYLSIFFSSLFSFLFVVQKEIRRISVLHHRSLDL